MNADNVNADNVNADNVDPDIPDRDVVNPDIHAGRVVNPDMAGPDVTAGVARDGHRRRRSFALVAAVATATALVVTGPMALAHTARLGAGSAAEPVTSNASVAGHPPATSVLPGGKWTALPKAPIVVRSGGVGVWTGRRLLVWGGSSSDGSRDYADGATYDPARRTWAVLPASPLSARTEMASVWTGHVLYVWGGQNAAGTALHDGAAYDPVRHTWTTLRRAPITSYASVQAFWLGGRLVLLTRPAGRSATHLDLHAYDPTHRTWTVLPPLRLPATRPALDSNAVQGGARLYVWSLWSRDKKVPGGYEGFSGTDTYYFDLSRGRWTREAVTPQVQDWVTGPLWTGREILLPASQLWCGFCPGPFLINSTGVRIDPRTGRARTIPHGPADDLNGQYLWTGSVLLAVDTEADLGRGFRAAHPGAAAYWRPSTNRWTRLPQAPLAGDAVSVWTGCAVLLWGDLSPTRGVKAGVKDTYGLQLSR